ncbi:hypothetical protein KUTeg_020797 [Tegillarca granosa]|uniref:Chitin-binding type-4 domain-containing protein n=1 Tax=Tegillarca granosa TaxID=220873 RepID=A0ABQ9EE94_TEGGR|nr:hypothetical protein KUTeg_020797 [Tegillarca granosa]
MEIDSLILVSVAALLFSICDVNGHGSAPINYNDNELFCGGLGIQTQNDGKCGTCGDPYDGERENEAGGKYAIGFISRTYRKGQEIPITVELTTAHKGAFWFKLCPHNDITTPVSQKCLDMHPLEIVGQTDDKYRYKVGYATGFYHLSVKLPADVTCSQCVFQWHYRAGNNYGCDPNGTCCTGCGPQETFINCADISIDGNDGVTGPTASVPVVSTSSWIQPSTSPKTVPITTRTPTTKAPPVTSSKITTVPPTSNVLTTQQQPAPTTTVADVIMICDQPDYVPDCVGVGIVPPPDLWCTKICREGQAGCTADRCYCTCVKEVKCVPVGDYNLLPGMTEWCNNNCANGACPDSSICDCQ